MLFFMKTKVAVVKGGSCEGVSCECKMDREESDELWL